jgi:hypothetical protein
VIESPHARNEARDRYGVTLFRHGWYILVSKTYEWLKVERNILIEREIDDWNVYSILDYEVPCLLALA